MPFTAKALVLLQASAEDVFDALTNERRLTAWLAENARVDLHAGVFHLWGRTLPGNPKEPVTRLETFEVPRKLRFGWQLFGSPSTVTLSLENRERNTVLAVEHVYSAPGPRDGKKLIHAGITDLWGLAFENLRRHLSGTGEPVFPDFTGTSHGAVELKIDAAVSPEQAFQALIDPDQLNRWIAREAAVDARPGGTYDFGWGHCPIKVLEIESGRKLSYSWQYGDEPETVVTWTLEGSGGGTRITLVHSGFAAKRRNEDYRIGWLKFLAAFCNFLEMGAEWRRAALYDEEFEFTEE